MQIIGLSGKIYTGKTFLTNLLLKQLGYGWERRAFGDALKEEVSVMFNLPLSWCYENKDYKVDVLFRRPDSTPPKCIMTVREILQWWGTEVRRAEKEDYWTYQLEKWIEDNSSRLKGIIVDDVRFPLEVATLIAHKAILFRLNPYSTWKCDLDIAAHESETALDDYTKVWDRSFSPEFGELETVAYEILHIKKQILGEEGGG